MKSKLRHIFWNLADGDKQLLEQSKSFSKNIFLLIGIIYLFVMIFVGTSLFWLFYRVFENGFIAIFTTVILGFLLTSIYRLNLLSFEPCVEASSISKKISGSDILRFGLLFIFGLFLSKSAEMILFDSLIHVEVLEIDGAKGYVDELIRLNKQHLWIWMLTGFNVTFFLTPIYLRTKLRKTNQYYAVKLKTERNMVINQYKNMYLQRTSTYNQLFEGEDRLTEVKYVNPPFNFDRVVQKKKPNSDFIGVFSDFYMED